MSEKDPRDQALDIIQDFASNLLLRDDLAPEVEKDLELIHALTRHRFDVLSIQDRARLEEIRSRNAGTANPATVDDTDKPAS